MTNAEDCTDCVYGPDFLDDGIPHRIITKMCERCQEEGAKALGFLMGLGSTSGLAQGGAVTALTVDCGTIGCRVVRDRLEKAEAEVERLREAIGDLVAASCDARDLPPGWSIVPTNTIEALRGDAS